MAAITAARHSAGPDILIIEKNKLLGRKILVTPGFVELGSIQDEENERFGERAAGVCDLVFLIGGERRAAPLLKGLQAKGYPEAQTSVCATLEEARGKLRELVRPGDVILFENDLPDIY